jgi:hypothetical protein
MKVKESIVWIRTVDSKIAIRTADLADIISRKKDPEK